MHNTIKRIALFSVILFSACGTSAPAPAAPEMHEATTEAQPVTDNAQNTEASAPAMEAVEESTPSSTAPALTMDQAAQPCSASETGFKTVTMGPMTFELPVGWSVVNRGDIAPMPLPAPEIDYLDASYIRYSFAKDQVAYGDFNWTQVDVYFTENDVVPAFIERLRGNEQAQSFTDHWETQMIGGQEAQVEVLKKNPDGSVDKGATGGAFTYFPQLNMIIHKQSLGDDAFEAGFNHFLSSVRFQ